MSYIGSNDRATLLGVLESIDRRLRSLKYEQAGSKLMRTSTRLAGAITELEALREEIAGAATRGPTPTPEQIAGIKITIPPESRARLEDDAAREIGYTVLGIPPGDPRRG